MFATLLLGGLLLLLIASWRTRRTAVEPPGVHHSDERKRFTQSDVAIQRATSLPIIVQMSLDSTVMLGLLLALPADRSPQRFSPQI